MRRVWSGGASGRRCGQSSAVTPKMLDALHAAAPAVQTYGPLTFDPITRELSGTYGRSLLQPHPAALLQRLLELPGALVSHSDLLMAMYPDPDAEPDSSEDMLRKIVMHLRLHLRRACGDGVRLWNEPSVGYALQLR